MNISQYQLPMEVGEEYKIASELNEVCDESNHEANLINICRLLVYLWFSCQQTFPFKALKMITLTVS